MAAINTAVEVDMTGQVCSDSIGHQFYSGIGGQVDFVRGASRSRGGKVIIALASTAKEGKVSTIVPELSPGAGVVTTRGSVRFVVTEWGWADLQGKNIRERAIALVNIAHPAFREQLLQAAKRRHYVYQDQILPPPGGLYPEAYETRVTLGGRELSCRPIKPTDDSLLKDLFYRLSDESIYKRYFSQIKIMPHERLQEETNVDYDTRMTMVCLAAREGGVEEAVALGQYVLDESTNRAEVAFMVRDDWHGKGIGTHLVRTVIGIAKEKGVEGITAVVWPQNQSMLNILYKLGYTVKSRYEDDAYRLSFDI
jgi:GNAT superfamily N-acetyltransferase